MLAPLQACDLQVVPAIWDDPNSNWKSFSLVVLRSCWDYHHKPRAFRDWIKRLEEEKVSVWNPTSIVRWNMEKTYLRELAARGVAIPKTEWLEVGDATPLLEIMQRNGFEHAVIKPTISATAHMTFRTSLATAQHDQAGLDEVLRFSGAMIQEFVAEIVTKGEWSLIFFDKKFSHAVLKQPRADDFRVQHDFGGTARLASPPAALIAQAQRLVGMIASPLLYARVDGVEREGRLLLIELELIEPQLFLSFSSAARLRFAEAISGLVQVGG